MRRKAWLAGAAGFGLLLASERQAHAQPEGAEDAPIFPGHRWLSTYTKEISFDAFAMQQDDGRVALAVGSSLAAFYKPWLSIQGAAQGALGLGNRRQTYDTRAITRLIWPEPLLGRLFVYGGPGFTVYFGESAPGSGVFKRSLGGVLAAGFWVQLSDQLRLRFEARDHLRLIGDTGNNLYGGVALVRQVR